MAHTGPALLQQSFDRKNTENAVYFQKEYGLRQDSAAHASSLNLLAV